MGKIVNETIQIARSGFSNWFDPDIFQGGEVVKRLQIIRSIAETTGVTEVALRSISLVKRTVETINITSSLVRGIGFTKRANETLNITTAISKFRERTSVVSENITIQSFRGSAIQLSRIVNEVLNITTTASSGSLPVANGSITISNAASPTNAELLEYCVELESKLESALAALRSVGIIAT